MTRILSVDPVSRIEGHLKIETEIDSGTVTRARVAGNMYRGFERMLLGRHPVDSARIAQRICGVCHEVHGVSSVMALEEIYKITPPENGLVLRDMILGLHIITDHLLHFYNLCLPDYADFSVAASYSGSDTRLKDIASWIRNSGTGFIGGAAEGDYIRDKDAVYRLALHYFEALKIRSEAASGLALLGGKVPFIHALLPGGITTEITADTLMKYYHVLEKTADFVNNSFLPDALEIARRYPQYFKIGETYNTFYAHSSFKNSKGANLFNAGVIINGERKTFDYSKVKELLSASFYDNSGRPDENRQGAYSWIKAPRYEGFPLEVGPVARFAVNNDAGFKSLLAKFGRADITSSTMSRILARAYESVRLCNYLFERSEDFRLGEPTIRPVDLQAPVTGQGVGFSVAARGALVHHITAEKGKVTDYKMIVPSTWNFGPAADGKAGVVEKAITGTPVRFGGEGGSVEVGRVVRSFDPCTACSVH
ncbi:MAG: nickel-dependent hydrogenase large subunit [Deferribacterales bacterium]